MSRTTLTIPGPPEAVFDVLADARAYSYWVVGSKEIRAADGRWPEVGAAFEHSVGFGPFTIKDHTIVLEMRRPELLRLKAKARPLGTAIVTLLLEPIESGTQVTMIEDPGDRVTALLFNRLTHLAVHGRNVFSLNRLCALVEGEIPIPGGVLREPDEHPDERPETRTVKNPAYRG